MKTFALSFFLMLVLISCKNEEENSGDREEINTETTETVDDSAESQSANRDGAQDTSEYSNESPDSSSEENKTSGAISNGTYVKMDEDDPNCSCYCIEVTTSGQSELCLKDEEMYINARFSRENGSVQIYYAGAAAKNTNDDLPWDEFDTDTPIAEMTSADDGMELDWKGFTINGELAVDYAIYGKKSLEGNYKKQ